jgi:hypothetical protein
MAGVVGIIGFGIMTGAICKNQHGLDRRRRRGAVGVE